MDIILILIAFFIILLLVGLIWGRNVETFADYATGKKKFSTRALVTAAVATFHGGGFFFRSLENGYSEGLYYGLAAIALPLSPFIVARFFALRMKEFLNHLSVAESMGTLYGSKVRIITAISSILMTIGSIAVQFQVIARIVSIFFGNQGTWPIVVAIALILFYSTLGGIRAVTFTDVIQFGVFIVAIPILIYFISSSIDTKGESFSSLITNTRFDLKKVIKWDIPFRDTLLLAFTFAIPKMSPIAVQRIYMTSNVWQARRVFSYTSLICVILNLLFFTSVTLLFIKKSTINTNGVLNYIMENYTNPYFLALMGLGILALAMSTADSDLNTSSVLFVNDILKVTKVEHRKSLILARITSLIIGCFGVVLAFWIKDFLKVFILCLSCYIPIVTAPFVMAIFGFRPATNSVLLGMGAGAFTVIGLKVMPLFGSTFKVSNVIIPGMLANLIVLLGSYYLLPKVPHTGWVGIKENAPLIIDAQRKARKRREFIRKLKGFNLLRYLQNSLPTATSDYVVAGAYLLFTHFFPFFFIKISPYWESYAFSIIQVPALIGTFMAFIYAITTKRAEYAKLAGFMWYVGRIYFCSFTSVLFLLMTNFGKSSILILVVGVATLLFYLQFRHFLGVMLMGTACAIFCFIHYGTPTTIQEVTCSGLYKKAYPLLLYTFLLYLFVRYVLKNKKREQKYSFHLAQEQYKQGKDLKRLQYEHYWERCTNNKRDEEELLPLITKDLENIIENTPPAQQKEAINSTIIPRLLSYVDFLQERIYYDRCHIPLSVTSTSLAAMLDSIIDDFEITHEVKLPIVVIDQVRKPIILVCDVMQIKRMLLATLHFIRGYKLVKNSDVIYIYLAATSIKYDMNGDEKRFKKLPAVSITMTTDTKVPVVEETYDELLDVVVPIVPNSEWEMYKKEMGEIADAHYGCMYIDDDENYMTINYILPLELDIIRGEVMDSLPESLRFLDASNKTSCQQEERLTNLLVEKTKMDKQFIEDTILFVKKCHGNQKRESGEPFYTHPMHVAEILLEETKDPATIVAALLHDVVEDSAISLTYLKARFGNDVAYIVSKVTNFGDTFRKKKMSSNSVYSTLLGHTNQDIRPIQVKLADRLHNVRTLDYRPQEKRMKVAKETLSLYVSIAAAIGMEKWAIELREKSKDILFGG